MYGLSFFLCSHVLCVPFRVLTNICEQDLCPLSYVNLVDARFLCRRTLGRMRQDESRSPPRALPRLENEAFRGLKIPASSFSPARVGGIQGLSFFPCFLFATPAAALRYTKSEGAPSNHQPVQIECAAKNAKARNGFEFSFEAPTGGVAAKPPPKPARTTAHTPSVASYIEVLIELSSSYCASCRCRLFGVTAICSQCLRGMHEQCFVVCRETTDGCRWMRRATREIIDGVLHVHVGGVPIL